MLGSTKQTIPERSADRRRLPTWRRRATRSWYDDTPDNGTVTALIQMQSLNDAYLEVVRVVDPKCSAITCAPVPR